MPSIIRPCEFEMDHEAYARFLLEHHDQLNLHYPFAMKLSFLASPLLMGRALLVFDEDKYELAGAAGFVLGTGPGEYEDRHICQAEIAFIRPAYRRTTVFRDGLLAFVELVRSANPDVRILQFWAPLDPGLRRLFAKFGAVPEDAGQASVDRPVKYTVPFHMLEHYCARLRRVSQ